MKKFLLSMGVALLALSASANTYTVFDIANPGTWTAKGTGFTSTVTVGGATFTLTTDQAESTTALKSPDYNTYAWRVYKNSSVTIESSITMKSMVITFDDYVDTNNGNATYYATWTLNNGWTGVLDGAVYTLSNAGSKSLTGISSEQQTRIVSILVSDSDDIDVPEQPSVDGVVYSNTFASSIDDWETNGWYVNSSIGCAVANSYKDGQNVAAEYWLTKTFDLKDYSDVALSVEQAFGFDFPDEQVANYTLNVREVGETNWNELVFTVFGEKPAAGKNWGKFAENNFDLSEYDGTKIEMGFRYITDGSKSRAWELKNFNLTGNKTGAVNGIVEESAPAVYYNLQGVRVANPEKGLYIRVEGNKATKIAK